MKTPRHQKLLAGFDPEPVTTAFPAEQLPGEVTTCRADDSPGGQPANALSGQPAHTDAMSGKSVWVIDAHALIYQVFHAMPEMSGPAGQPVGAIHGFIRDVVDLLEKKSPDYLVCAFDHGDVTFRHDIYEGYKQRRSSMPDDLRAQIEPIGRMLDALGIVRLSVPGYEADDILATIARQVREGGGECFLVTNDKDCWQLVGGPVHIYNIRKDQLLDADALRRQWGIRPDQVVDYQALVGDPVDDVPGVPLIGPKIAGELLARYGTLEGVFEHVAEVAGAKRKENLIRYREQALVSRRLVRLADDVPLPLDWEQARAGRFRREELETLCREFGFRQLGERLLQLAETAPAAVARSDQYHTVTSLEQLAGLLAEIRQQGGMVVDLETTSIFPRWAEIVGVALAWRAGEGWYVPVSCPPGEPRLELAAVLSLLRPVLEDPAIAKIGQNLKYDMVVLRSHGVALRGLKFDSMVADYLLAPGERNHSLDDLARRYLRHATIKIESLIGKGKQQRRMDEVPVADVTRYAGEDADIPLRLVPVLGPRLESAGLRALFETLEMPLIEVLAELEYHGIRVDVSRLRELSRRFAERLETLEREIYELAGERFNIDSPRQLADILFQRLRLPVVKRTRSSGPSTDADVLEELAAQHPLPKRILVYRQLAKLKGTYVDALPQLVHPVTGRVHTSFKQDVAATGRLSSQDPNLQNIPIRTPEGRDIRSAFLPEAGWQLLTADYSQIELRLLAHFSADPALLAAFAGDEDIHAAVASEVFGVPPDQVQPEMRRRAKAVNFGIIYGQTAFGLAKSLGIPQDEAAAFIDSYFARYPGVSQFMEKTLEACREKGYVSTISGRRRAVEGVRAASVRSDVRSRILPERIAINTVIQGSAADVIKQAMIQVHRRLQQARLQARMLLQIHDELVFEVPPSELAYLVELVVSEMAGAVSLITPLKVDVKSGANWAACDDVQ